MGPTFRVRVVVFASGERFPVLLDQSGCPLFRPTVFALTQVRGRNLSTNTISNVLRAIVVLEHFLAVQRVDIESRLELGSLLSVAEVEGLVRSCRQPLAELVARTLDPCAHSKTPPQAKEAMRGRPSRQDLKEVAPQVASTRLLYIRAYLAWLVDERRSRHGVSNELLARFQTASEITLGALDSRTRYSPIGGTQIEREGLSEGQQEELLRITDPSCVDNPWRDEHTRYRNALLVRWLLNLGLRIGELLGVRNSDIDIRLGEVTIHRRADDPDDPRRNQPQTKTRARVLQVQHELLAQTQAYILDHRSVLPKSKTHGFLFVASRSGRPLTIAAAEKVFETLRTACPELPEHLSPHLLRHTWNDTFSSQMDAAQVASADEQKYRSYLMGWSPTSDTAAVYTRRHIRRKARAASLAMQQRVFAKGDKDE
ncbi:tyrosine-type recombinase/integrase [Xanthomonas sacchari]|uniref:tyrosine-type recombinase/integrase n=1 Tax=Xanthomonas sacchari TaxID=56458 RepID=UPI00224F2555|nr:site-specific integrase [Xanthomonas sacchari]MCW0453842.1 Tyrosine recombinase XerC [Xanthomonas sacchari]